jgi:hypothetical protein
MHFFLYSCGSSCMTNNIKSEDEIKAILVPTEEPLQKQQVKELLLSSPYITVQLRQRGCYTYI